jgi:hypothetical protein
LATHEPRSRRQSRDSGDAWHDDPGVTSRPRRPGARMSFPRIKTCSEPGGRGFRCTIGLACIRGPGARRTLGGGRRLRVSPIGEGEDVVRRRAHKWDAQQGQERQGQHGQARSFRGRIHAKDVRRITCAAAHAGGLSGSLPSPSLPASPAPPRRAPRCSRHPPDHRAGAREVRGRADLIAIVRHPAPIVDEPAPRLPARPRSCDAPA